MKKINSRLDKRKKIIFWGIVFLLLGSGVVLWQWPGAGKLVSSFLGTSNKAVLKLEPATGVFKVGDSFQLKVKLDTKGNKVVAVAVSLSYNPEIFEILNIDTSASDFLVGSECVYQSGPCQLINNDRNTGRLSLIQGRPTPGVNKNDALIAILTVRGKKEVSSLADNFVFDFSGGAQSKSKVILDDGQGTDILSGTENGCYSLESVSGTESASTPPATPTPPTPPSTTTPTSTPPADREAPLLSVIRVSEITEKSAKVSWQTDEPATSFVYYIGESDLFLEEVKKNEFVLFHEITLTNLTPASRYYFIVKSQDSSGNARESKMQSFQTLAAAATPTSTPTSTPPVTPTSTPPATPTSTPGNESLEKMQLIANLKKQIAEILARLASLQAELKKVQTSPKPAETPAYIPAGFRFLNNLYPGQKGLEVSYLQIFLKNQGEEIYPSGKVTGFFGPLTEAAVIRFQEKYREEILLPGGMEHGSGVVGRATRIKINSLLGQQE